ncbi:MAG: alanine dehydrogenase [Chloracidobacterium sp. CP2_5A]|nr:MAG: alanine dehydrogenase [Chloracidobacterium sp. CP2_5A]
MNELDALLAALHRFTSSGLRLALATVASVSGSAYRRPGARMLIAENGETIGSVSGGCLEQDLIEKAQAIMATGRAQLVTYDTRDVAADMTWGVGLGCESETLIYVEPFYPSLAHHPLELLALAAATGEAAARAQVFRAEGNLAGRAGFQLLYTAATPPAEGDSAEQAGWLRHLHRELQACLTERRSRHTTYGTEQGRLEAFIEFLPPPLQLTILGAGDDAIPLAQLATQLGWRVTVADWRPALAAPERFPAACRVVTAPTVDELPMEALDCVVVMTHHYPSDKSIARRLAAVRPRYVGLLGPRRRTERILKELADEGAPVPAGVVADWRFPVGLDLGAETPAEIAAAIVAEILAVTRGHSGTPLRDRAAPIHEPPPSSA